MELSTTGLPVKATVKMGGPDSNDFKDLGLLLRSLITDGYLVKADGQYRFRSPLLRDYWKETYC